MRHATPPAPESHLAQVATIRALITKHFGTPWPHLPHPTLAVRKTDEVDGLKRQVCTVHLDARYHAPVCIITPLGAPPYPTILVIHGGDGGLDVCCGPGLGRTGGTHYHHDMSLELSRAGFLTVTVSLRALGREAQDWGHGDCGKHMETRDDFVGYTIFRGSCPMNVWTHDCIKVLDAMLQDPRVDRDRLAVAGISTGGELALYVGALDERVRAVCSHGALISYEEMYTLAHNWAIHAIPGAIGNFDMGDAGRACFPRPLQIQVGENEPAFWGRNRPSTFTELDRIRSFYGPHAPTPELVVTPGGGHAFDTAAAVRFLDTVLPARARAG